MANEFLLEVGCEEIPHGMVLPALESLKERLCAELALAGFAHAGLQAFATPRRLAVSLPDLPARQPDRVEEVTGPPASAGLDAEGKFTRAALGFAAKQGAAESDLSVAETAKGRYILLRKKIAGRATRDILAAALPGVIRGISFPKTMVWDDPEFSFVRPLRNLLALFAGEVVPFALAGVASGDRTFGHRFRGDASIPVRSLAEYLDRLQANGVMADPQAREKKIRGEIAALEASSGLTLVPDEELMGQVVLLNEWPSVIMGGFDHRFLALPREVLVTVSRKHQKYFSLNDATGDLAPSFLAVINTDGDPEGLIRSGHERVLAARLNDAAFFWNADRKAAPAQRVDSLEHVLFQEALGSYLEKTRRVEALVPCVAAGLGLSTAETDQAREAARICKTDLTTEMVKELTELQGIMGGLYAREAGADEGVWKAVYAHYRPEGPGDPVPDTLPGAALAIADKMDSIVGMLGLGFAPTGSRDPFGLRRQAAGVCRILVETTLDLDLRPVVRRAAELLGDRLKLSAEDLERSFADFFAVRAQTLFQGLGFGFDEVRSVGERAVWRPADARRRLDALAGIRGLAQYAGLFVARKRVSNILSKLTETVTGDPEARLFQDGAERALHETLGEVETPFRQAVEEGRYTDALALTERFAAPVDDFFTKVLVMHEDAGIRLNRLRLLARIGSLFDELCDFSTLVMEGK